MTSTRSLTSGVRKVECGCSLAGLCLPDRDSHFFDIQRLGNIALRVGAEEAGIQVWLLVEEGGMGDCECVR